MLIGECYVTDVTAKLPRHAMLTYERRPLAAVDTVVIHHVGAAERDYLAAELAAFHVDVRLWPGIAYHFLIHPDGRIELTGEPDTVRWHAGRWNVRSLGVCLAGTFDRQAPTGRALSRCRQLCEALSRHVGRPLAVRGHRDLPDTGYGPTDCPGRTWPTWRALVMPGAASAPAKGPSPPATGKPLTPSLSPAERERGAEGGVRVTLVPPAWPAWREA